MLPMALEVLKLTSEVVLAEENRMVEPRGFEPLTS
jgi:hypothetical protein